jgi:RNA polymerase sigma-70 factor (ECF subfamily)
MIPSHAETRGWMAAWRDHGDEAAARALVEALYPYVVTVIRRHAGESACVEDLAQDVFVRCFANAARWDPSKPLEPWIARIVVNRCRDSFRARRVRPELRWSDLTSGAREAVQATLESSDPNPDPSASALDAESHALLLRLLDTLEADDRLVLSLLHLEGKSTAEIAGLTGWSRVLVKVRAFRARAKLRAAFEALEATKP